MCSISHVMLLLRAHVGILSIYTHVVASLAAITVCKCFHFPISQHKTEYYNHNVLPEIMHF